MMVVDCIRRSSSFLWPVLLSDYNRNSWETERKRGVLTSLFLWSERGAQKLLTLKLLLPPFNLGLSWGRLGFHSVKEVVGSGFVEGTNLGLSQGQLEQSF